MLLGSNLDQIDKESHEAVQLRSGLSVQGELSFEAINRGLNCLTAFSAQLRQFDPHPDYVRVVATAALRLAHNRELFLSHASKRLGYAIELISGEAEAAFIYQGFRDYLRLTPGLKILGIDIGGGSTELVVGLEALAERSLSISLGCLDLQMYFLDKSSCKAKQFNLALHRVETKLKQAAIQRQIQGLVDFGWQAVFAGSGSAKLLRQMKQFLGLGHDTTLSLANIEQIQAYLISLKEDEPLQQMGLKAYQLAILPCVVVIFLALMKQLRLEKLTILPVSLRHGVLATMRSSILQPLKHNS